MRKRHEVIEDRRAVGVKMQRTRGKRRQQREENEGLKGYSGEGEGEERGEIMSV